MKRIFCCTGILVLISATLNAQVKSSKTNRKQSVHTKPVPTNRISNTKPEGSSNTTMLNTTFSYPAKANSLSVLKNNYPISDPILTKLHERAGGANIQFNKSGIVGMPKRAYGFANGHISLNSTGAVTSGTQTGSGAVGTGTSLATFGSVGSPMNVNGKSPYAGVNMWGNAMNMKILAKDSSVRLAPADRQARRHE